MGASAHHPERPGQDVEARVVLPDGVVVPVYTHSYRELGYLPDAMFNFLCGIGWSLDGPTDIYDRETALELSASTASGVAQSPAR